MSDGERDSFDELKERAGRPSVARAQHFRQTEGGSAAPTQVKVLESVMTEEELRKRLGYLSAEYYDSLAEAGMETDAIVVTRAALEECMFNGPVEIRLDKPRSVKLTVEQAGTAVATLSGEVFPYLPDTAFSNRRFCAEVAFIKRQPGIWTPHRIMLTSTAVEDLAITDDGVGTRDLSTSVTCQCEMQVLQGRTQPVPVLKVIENP